LKVTLYDLPAPAKLNLFLHVVGRRPDGYHLLESVFRLVSLADSITIDLRRDGQLSCQSNRSDQAGAPMDLALQAGQLLQRETGCHLGAHLVVHKRIPVGGGLGGGSSDAATVLMALNRLWRTGLNRQQLMHLGLKLGADVPFFIHGRSAFVQGVGEQMESVDLTDLSYLIVKPSVAVSTAAIFGAEDLTRNTERVKMSDFSGCNRFIGESTSEDMVKNPSAGFGRNDLQPSVLAAYPSVGAAMDWVVHQGHKVRLSGSGSCFFAEFDGPEQVELARSVLAAKIELFDREYSNQSIEKILACDGLREHPLRHWIEG